MSKFWRPSEQPTDAWRPGAPERLLERGAAFPASCADCIGANGDLAGYHRYQLAQDAKLRMGFMSFTQDRVVANDS